jgi:hypothetical protein
VAPSSCARRGEERNAVIQSMKLIEKRFFMEQKTSVLFLTAVLLPGKTLG